MSTQEIARGAALESDCRSSQFRAEEKFPTWAEYPSGGGVTLGIQLQGFQDAGQSVGSGNPDPGLQSSQSSLSPLHRSKHIPEPAKARHVSNQTLRIPTSL